MRPGEAASPGRIGQIGTLRLHFPRPGWVAEGPIHSFGAEHPLTSVMFAAGPGAAPFSLTVTLPRWVDMPPEVPARRGRPVQHGRHVALLLARRYLQATRRISVTRARQVVADLITNGTWQYRQGANDAGAVARAERLVPQAVQQLPWLILTQADGSDVVLVPVDAELRDTGGEPAALHGNVLSWRVGEVEAFLCSAVADLPAGIKGIN